MDRTHCAQTLRHARTIRMCGRVFVATTGRSDSGKTFGAVASGRDPRDAAAPFQRCIAAHCSSAMRFAGRIAEIRKGFACESQPQSQETCRN
ncbi:MAG: hypothetical protein JF591_19225 [Lysobacter sp.]|nr:hypothetical protein [Lysobacter sp.]